MNKDTPLKEVAHHLPTEAASLLLRCSAQVQEAVLRQVREVVSAWEEQGAALDPIAYGVVMNTFVTAVAANGDFIERLLTVNLELQSRLLAADLQHGKGQAS